MVGDSDKQRLAARIFASECKEADGVVLQIDFAACKAMLPMLGHLEAGSQQMHAIGFVSSAQKDHGAAGLGTQIKSQASGIGPSRRGTVTPLHAAGTVARGIASRDCFQVRQIEELITLPHFGLPQSIKALDGILKARLARRSKHRNDT
jgi:hypothetical protein